MATKSNKTPAHWPAELKRELREPIANELLAPAEMQRKLNLLMEHLCINKLAARRKAEGQQIDPSELCLLALLALCKELFPGFQVKTKTGARVRTVYNDLSLVLQIRLMMARHGVGVLSAAKQLQKAEPEWRKGPPESLKTRYHEAVRRAEVAAILQSLERLPPLFAFKGAEPGIFEQ